MSTYLHLDCFGVTYEDLVLFIRFVVKRFGSADSDLRCGDKTRKMQSLTNEKCFNNLTKESFEYVVPTTLAAIFYAMWLINILQHLY